MAWGVIVSDSRRCQQVAITPAILDPGVNPEGGSPRLEGGMHSQAKVSDVPNHQGGLHELLQSGISILVLFLGSNNKTVALALRFRTPHQVEALLISDGF